MALTFAVNLWAVLVIALVNMIIGWLWYSPVLFMKPWVKAMGWTEKEMAKGKKDMNMGRTMGGMFLFALATAYVTAVLFASVGVASVSLAITLGALLALGIVTTTSSGASLFEGRPWTAFWINAGYQLVWFVVAGVILTMWR